MNIKEMQYDFKKKLNKIDSQQNKNLLIPEIDWSLNEAIELFVKMVAFPRLRSYLGFEKHQRTMDDVASLVREVTIPVAANVAPLPTDYWHYLRARVGMTKSGCSQVHGTLHIRQHDDEFENSPFDKSSFKWKFINGLFTELGIKLYDDGTFTNDELVMSYLRKPVYVHNAEDFRTGTYTLPSGTVLTGTQDCDLPEHTHREIVDLAVLIATGEIQASDYQIKMAKLRLNNLT